MLYSMTGYGRAEETINDTAYIVEIRSLNGKQFDLRLTIPAFLKPYEIEIRNILNEKLIRGSVECVITMRQNNPSNAVTVNTTMLKSYIDPLLQVAREMHLNTDAMLASLLKMPDVLLPSIETMQENDWTGFEALLKSAVEALNQYRENEGAGLEADLLLRIENIEKQQNVISGLEPERRKKIRDGLMKLLEENVGKENYDANRLEQEMIYYIEKIDISEEQVRLRNHCIYFKEVMATGEMTKGKKLSFILQEIGREINTTGSKAYDAEIQKAVVLMKDELEKAKEQILNIL